MANKLEIGARVLFISHAGAPVRSGIVREYSPSGAYVGLEVGRGEEWLPVATLGLVEQLAADPLETVAIEPARPSLPVEELAGRLYAKYCEQVGGKAFNGDPLPDWKTFCADSNKQVQSYAWVAVAALAQTL